jgi:RNA recognition motif-containing protein
VSTMLTVRNLMPSVLPLDLLRVFEPFGTVLAAGVGGDPLPGSNGHGYVEMQCPAEARAAAAGLHGSKLQGRTISVSEELPRGPPRATDRTRTEGDVRGNRARVQPTIDGSAR